MAARVLVTGRGRGCLGLRIGVGVVVAEVVVEVVVVAEVVVILRILCLRMGKEEHLEVLGIVLVVQDQEMVQIILLVGVSSRREYMMQSMDVALQDLRLLMVYLT